VDVGVHRRLPGCRAVEHAVARLSSLTEDAVQALQRCVTCGNPAVEARTANSILENVRAMAQHQELEDRLAALEQRLAEAKQNNTTTNKENER
jgi:hypothetical protein